MTKPIAKEMLCSMSGLLLLLANIISNTNALAEESTTAKFFGSHVLEFDVAESAPKFVFDEAPVFDDGFPAYGNSFVTQGYIYPFNTLSDSNGVNPDGSPEFPELVIGEWTCRGFFIGDGAHTLTGPWVITTQHYDFYDEPGFADNKQSSSKNIISDGYELVDIGIEGERAITGGTGIFKRARGEAVQTLLGFNASEGVNLRFKLKLRR